MKQKVFESNSYVFMLWIKFVSDVVYFFFFILMYNYYSFRVLENVIL